MSSLMRFDLTPYSLIFEAGGDYPARRVNKIFQVQDRSAGGKLHVENLGISNRTRTIHFNLMPKADYVNLIDWFLNIVKAGYINFTFTDEYGDSGLVKITDDEIDFAETSLERYSGSINLEYV